MYRWTESRSISKAISVVCWSYSNTMCVCSHTLSFFLFVLCVLFLPSPLACRSPFPLTLPTFHPLPSYIPSFSSLLPAYLFSVPPHSDPFLHSLQPLLAFAFRLPLPPYFLATFPFLPFPPHSYYPSSRRFRTSGGYETVSSFRRRRWCSRCRIGSKLGIR